MIVLSGVPDASGIYMILNAVTGKCYIGSALHLVRRLRCHVSTLSSRTHKSSRLQRSWDKYGPDAFFAVVVERVPDRAMLLAREQVWLDAMRSSEEGFGYNIHSTAASALGVKRSEETKAKLSAANKGKTGREVSDETRQKIRAAHAYRSPASYTNLIAASRIATRGRKLSSSHVAALRAGHKKAVAGTPKSEKHRMKLAEAQLGRKLPESVKVAMSKARKGRPWSPARRAAYEATRRQTEHQTV